MAEKLCALRKKGGGKAPQYTETSLWTNPSPSADFAAQTVSLSGNISDYKYIAIKFKATKTEADSSAIKSVVSVADLARVGISANNPNIRIGGMTAGAYPYSRHFIMASDTSITFGASVLSYASGSGATMNSTAIPLEILGINELAQGTVQTATGTFTTTSGSIANYTVNLGFRPRFIAVYFNGRTGSMSGSTTAAGSSRCIYDATVNTSYTFRDYKGSNSYVTMAPISYSGDTQIAEITDTGFVWRNASGSDWAGEHHYFAIGSTTE